MRPPEGTFVKSMDGAELAARAKMLLESNGLSRLPGRPFDNAFATIAKRPVGDRRLVVVGFNGSNADLEWTNDSAIDHGLQNPSFSNLELGLDKGWGGTTRLAKALKCIPELLGLNWQEVVYTNAILTCSKDVLSLSKIIKNDPFSYGKNGSIQLLIQNSMNFFLQFTMKEFHPSVIVCHGNGEASISTAMILREFLKGGELSHLDHRSYHRAYSFNFEYHGDRIPVLCLRHMSRFALNKDAIGRFSESIR